MPKYIFVTGGVISSLGKGISAAAIGALLECRGLRVNFVKMDPYINVDPGTMNPLHTSTIQYLLKYKGLPFLSHKKYPSQH